jgi:hypothetical protein
MESSGEPEGPLRDEYRAHPIANVWRPAIQDIVKAFVQGDYSLLRNIQGVEPLDPVKAARIRDYILEYGENLVELPEECWRTSVAQWMRSHWELVVDLWTVESGQSDLVLSVRIFEMGQGFRIEVDSVHVP